MIKVQSKITSVTHLGDDYAVVELHCPQVAPLCKPGHFVNIRCDKVLLRRPIAVLDVEGEVIKFFIQKTGEGTRWITSRKPGDILDIVGPLGKGLFETNNAKRVILVAGGVGLAPLYYYLSDAKKYNIETLLFYGARTAGRIFFQHELMKLADRCVFVTEDGTMGKKGRVTDELKRFYFESGAGSADMIMACGPKFMLREVVAFADSEDVPCQVSLESYMGCGAGVCLSCVIPAKKHEYEAEVYIKLCTDGPVLDSKLIDNTFFEE